MTATSTPAPTGAQLLFIDLERELAATRRVLERVPDGRFDWQPHAKSMTLGRLASHVADLPRFGWLILAGDDYDFATGQHVPVRATTTAELLAAFDANAASLREAVAAADETTLASTWTLRSGDHVIVTGSRAALGRTLGLNHLLHHRSQLGVYLRLLDVPVPGLYGPSADER